MRALRRICTFGLLLACAATLPGCLHGWIYENYTVPVVENMRNTPRGTRMVELSSIHVQVPYTNGMVDADIWSRAIGDAARAKGLSVIYFADQRTQSWFGDLFRCDTIEVWGD